MTQMIRLFAAASTQPSQHLLPTRMVEQIVSTQDKQSSRNTSESICSFIWVIFLRIDLQVCIRGYDGVTFVTLRPSVFAIPGNTRARDWRTFQPDASFNLPKRARPNYWRNIPITVKILRQNRGGANRRVESRTGAVALVFRWLMTRLSPTLPQSGLAWLCFLLPSRPGEFRPEPLTDPCLTVSGHTARATRGRPAPSAETIGFLLLPVDPCRSRLGDPPPFAPRELPRLIATTEQSAPVRHIGTVGLAGLPLGPSPLSLPTRFSSSVRKPG
jgi:hypothetical protein